MPILRTLGIRGTRQNVSTDHLRQNVEPSRRGDSARSAPLRWQDMLAPANRSTDLAPRRYALTIRQARAARSGQYALAKGAADPAIGDDRWSGAMTGRGRWPRRVLLDRLWVDHDGLALWAAGRAALGGTEPARGQNDRALSGLVVRDPVHRHDLRAQGEAPCNQPARPHLNATVRTIHVP